jgi:hypothetical protein
MPPDPSGAVPTLPLALNATEKIESITTGNRNVKNRVSPWRK